MISLDFAPFPSYFMALHGREPDVTHRDGIHPKGFTMGKVFIDRREGERRIGERRNLTPEGYKMQQRVLETISERRLNVERRQRERRD